VIDGKYAITAKQKAFQSSYHSTQHDILEISLKKDWAASFIPSDRDGKMWLEDMISPMVKPYFTV